MDGDHTYCIADDPCDYGYAYAAFRHRTGIDIANTRGDALRLVVRRTGRKNLRLSGRYDEAVCVVRIECDALTCADIWRLRAE